MRRRRRMEKCIAWMRPAKAEVFYDPHTKYIWAMAFSKSGDLFVATGDQGEIHRVTPAGKGSVFFKTEETHARSLAIDANDNLIAGTDPSGLVLRITPAGQGFVLYQTPKREVTAVAVASDGSIYAAAAGNKQTAPSVPVAPAPVPTPSPAPGGGSTTLTVGARPTTPSPGLGASAISGGSEVYRIQPDGYPRKIWSHAQDVVYALALDSRGRLMLGTGNHGSIYRVDTDHSYTRLLDVAPAQVTGFCGGTDGRIYAVTGNIGTVVSVGGEMAASGSLESDVFDAGGFTYWGRLSSEPKATGTIGEV